MSKKFRFASSGDMTIILRGTYYQPVTNAFGQVIAQKAVPPIKAVFNGGYWDTEDPNAVQLLKDTVHWNNDVYWFPGCEPKDEIPDDKPEAKKASAAKSKSIVAARSKKAERRRKGQENALEGNVPKE